MSEKETCDDCGGPVVLAVPSLDCDHHPLAELVAKDGYYATDSTHVFMDWEDPASGAFLVEAEYVERRTIYITPDHCAAYATPDLAAVPWCPLCGER